MSINNLGIVTGLKSELKTLSDLNLTSLSGYGPLNAKKAAIKLVKKKVSCLISFGLAGSCDNSIKVGDIMIPNNIIWRNFSKNKTSEIFRGKIIAKLSNKNFHSRDLYSSKNIIYSKIKKKEISSRFNVGSVDMESEDIQKIAKKNNIPFVAVRVVIDDLQIEIPKFILEATNKDGVINYLVIILGIIKRPSSLISIIKLGIYYYTGLRKLKKIGQLIFNDL